MTVEHLTLKRGEDPIAAEMTAVKLCEPHHGELRTLLIARGFGDELMDERDLSDEEYMQMVENGEPNAMLEVTQHMIMGVIATMGAAVFAQYDGCPVCVLEGTLERAADEIVIQRRKKN